MEDKTITDHMQEMRGMIREMIHAGFSLPDATDAFKKAYAMQAVIIHRGNQCKAARAVSAHRNTLHRIISQKAG